MTSTSSTTTPTLRTYLRRRAVRIPAIVIAAGLAFAFAIPGEAKPAGSAAPPTPAPTATVTMTTPAGEQSNPTLDAGWNVQQTGIRGTLTVEGKSASADPLGLTTPVDPTLFPTTVTALWTSSLITVWSHNLGANVILSWDDGIPPAVGLSAPASRQTLRVRYGDAKGHWGRWTTLYDQPFTDSPTAYFTTGGPIKTFDNVRYAGKVPAKKVRVQFSLTDLLPQGAFLQQSLSIDLDPGGASGYSVM